MPRNPRSGRRYPPRQPQIRRNERIRVREVRVIGPDGKQIGVMKTDDARALAKRYGLDLVEIAASARPPVCRILDFGKYKYELSKKQKEKKQATTSIKEVRFRVRIEQHDYMVKVRRAEAFLFKGNKVKLNLMFRGREMEYQEIGFGVIRRAVEDLAGVATQDSPAKRTGRHITTILSPLPQNKRKLVHNESEAHLDHHDEHDDDHDDDHHDEHEEEHLDEE